MSLPVSGNHHDLYKIEDALKEIFLMLKSAEISLDELFLNANITQLQKRTKVKAINKYDTIFYSGHCTGLNNYNFFKREL